MTRASLVGVALVALSLPACRPQAPEGSSGSAAKTETRAEAKPAAPAREPLVLPEGTELKVTLETAVSSGTSKAGDLVVAKLASDVTRGERVLLPAGTEVRGKVVRAVASGRVKGRAELVVEFNRIEAKDASLPIEASRIDITAGAQHKRDAAIIGGGAAGGALIGGIAGGGKGAGIGALIGGVAGTGAVLATKGKEVELPAGTPVTLRLTRSATLA